MLREAIIQKSIGDEIIMTVWHDFTVYVSDVVRSLVKISILFGIFLLLEYIRPWDSWFVYVRRAIACIWLYFLLKYCIDFFNLYLDCIVLTPSSLQVFFRHWLFKYNVNVFERKQIGMISFEQDTLWDKIFHRGRIKIILIGTETTFTFDAVAEPQKAAHAIYSYKEKFTSNKEKQEEEKVTQNDANDNDEKMHILLDAVREVLEEYMQKKHWQ